ncbi:MAG TPA: hypothetical protein VFQ53_10565 [Kofleriaceae bacterium]|nr:hypothetical protein [Kofleriaceae bacterium]
MVGPRLALAFALAFTACTPAQAPKARKVGKVMALGGVGGLIATSFAARYTSNTQVLLLGFSLTSAVGIGTYAAGDLAVPEAEVETIPERNHRWARILTERAAGAAREGRCPRVRRLETKVQLYDPEIHDFVFMRDPEIVKCVTGPGIAAPGPTVPEVPVLAPIVESPALEPPP